MIPPLPPSPFPIPGPLGRRSFVGRYFAIEFDSGPHGRPGVPAGFVRSVSGGGIKSELHAQQFGGHARRTKGLHNPTIEPITFTVGLSMAKPMFDWIASSWSGDVKRHNGAINTYDANFLLVHRYEFYDALILETTMPAFDAASNEPAFLTVKFLPERAEHSFPPPVPALPSVATPLQKLWSPSNFVMELDGMPLFRVNKIDSFTVKQNVKQMSCGPDWMYQLEPTSLEYPNISVHFAMGPSALPWFLWHKSFVIEGKNGPENEKTGAIVLLSSGIVKVPLLMVELRQVGICNLQVDDRDSTRRDQILRCKADLYCEEMVLRPLASIGLPSGLPGI